MSSDLPAAAPTVELGPALSGLTSDPQWLKKYGMAGLMLFIPLVGPLILLGWVRRVYEAAREDDIDTLPDVDFGADLSHGVPPFAAMLNLMLPAMVMAMGVWFVATFVMIAASAASSSSSGDPNGALGLVMGLFMLGFYALLFAGILLMNVAVPEFQRRGFNGETLPLFSLGQSFRAVRAAPGAYLMVLVGLFVANAISSVGVFACYVGMVITVPMAMVVIARLLAQWDRVVAHHEV
ncbi:MAG: DUF4013 domain-containing protein [Alphaproteobacteria bacterium]|nr:DUF4013 domain-containing protein [Alphaproteobacteria bacterium]